MKIIYATILAFVLSCSVSPLTEVDRLSNKGASLDAVTAIRNTDATVATPTEIHVVSKGAPLGEAAVFRADKIKGLTLTWKNEETLVIHAAEARIFLYSPTLTIVFADDKSTKITIHLDIKNVF